MTTAMGREMKKLRKDYSNHELRLDTSANSGAVVAKRLAASRTLFLISCSSLFLACPGCTKADAECEQPEISPGHFRDHLSQSNLTPRMELPAEFAVHAAHRCGAHSLPSHSARRLYASGSPPAL